eukprot:10645031-Alexandrium_andersonii.AAC.1
MPPRGPVEGVPQGQAPLQQQQAAQQQLQLQTLADIGLRFVQEQMRAAASGTPMDPAVIAFIRT